MKSKDKTCIEYALHAYDILWDYYKKTLDERNHILKNRCDRGRRRCENRSN